MTTYEPDVEAIPAGVDEERLLTALDGRDGEITPELALRALSARGSLRGLEALGRLAADSRKPSALRVAAAHVLGRTRMGPGQAALLPLLRDRDPAVVASAADALGRSGDLRALAALDALPSPGNDANARRLRFARSLLSYRFGAGSHLLPRPAEADLVAAGPNAIAIEHRKAPRETAAQAVGDAGRDLPGIALAADRAESMRCLGMDLLLAPTESVTVPGGVARLADRNAVLSVLLRRWECPERWAPALLIFSHPDRDGVALVATRPDGTVVGGGQVSAGDTRRSFRVRSLRSSVFAPVELEASFSADEGFRFVRAVSAATTDPQAGRRTPRRAR